MDYCPPPCVGGDIETKVMIDMEKEGERQTQDLKKYIYIFTHSLI